MVRLRPRFVVEHTPRHSARLRLQRLGQTFGHNRHKADLACLEGIPGLRFVLSGDGTP